MDQKKSRKEAAAHYENVVGMVIKECEILANDVCNRCKKEKIEDKGDKYSEEVIPNQPMN